MLDVTFTRPDGDLEAFERRVEAAFRAQGWTDAPPLAGMHLRKGPYDLTGACGGGCRWVVGTSDLSVDASLIDGDRTVPGLYGTDVGLLDTTTRPRTPHRT